MVNASRLNCPAADFAMPFAIRFAMVLAAPFAKSPSIGAGIIRIMIILINKVVHGDPLSEISYV